MSALKLSRGFAAAKRRQIRRLERLLGASLYRAFCAFDELC